MLLERTCVLYQIVNELLGRFGRLYSFILAHLLWGQLAEELPRAVGHRREKLSGLSASVKLSLVFDGVALD